MSNKKLLSESAIRRLMKYANLDQATAEDFLSRTAIQEEESAPELELDAAAELDDAHDELEDAGADIADAADDLAGAEADMVAAADAPMDEEQVEALVDAVLGAISDVTGVEAEVVSDVAAAEAEADADLEMVAVGAEELAGDELAGDELEMDAELAEDAIDTELHHDDENIKDDYEHIDALKKDIEGDEEEKRRADRARTNESALVARVTRRVAERLLGGLAAPTTDTPTKAE